MSNVIKQRQLVDGQKLTPKSDFVYSFNAVDSANAPIVYNTDGTTKKQLTAVDKGLQYTSVGKGQFIRLAMSSGGTTYIDLWDKATETSNGASITLASGRLLEEEQKTKNLITFLGKPFQASGDNDRYIIFTGYNFDAANPNTYSICLMNVDTWTVTSYKLAYSNIQYDFVYSGGDWVYATNLQNNNVLQIGITNGVLGAVTALKDNLENVVKATRVYGMSAERIAIKGLSNELQVYNLTDLSLKTKGDVVNCIDTSAQTYLVCRTDGNIEYLNIGLNSQYNLTQSLIDGGVIGAQNGNCFPVLITNYVDTGAQYEITYVFIRGDIDNSRNLRGVKSTISYDGTTITSTMLGYVDGINLFEPNIEQTTNAFANTCNTYGIGKFYNYGLQKQWDNNHETM